MHDRIVSCKVPAPLCEGSSECIGHGFCIQCLGMLCGAAVAHHDVPDNLQESRNLKSCCSQVDAT